MLDNIKEIGYKYSTRASFSISVYDMKIPEEKKTFIKAAELGTITGAARELNFAQSSASAQIQQLEKELGFSKETIYAMALLHDIGRNLEYEKGLSHHEIGGAIALDILTQVGFSNEEKELICQAIRSHKELGDKEDNCSLNYLLYRADKLSRNCFSCKAKDSCYWDESKKNKGIIV